MTNAEAWFNIALRPRKTRRLVRTAALDSHLDSHTAPELCEEGRDLVLLSPVNHDGYNDQGERLSGAG